MVKTSGHSSHRTIPFRAFALMLRKRKELDDYLALSNLSERAKRLHRLAWREGRRIGIDFRRAKMFAECSTINGILSSDMAKRSIFGQLAPDGSFELKSHVASSATDQEDAFLSRFSYTNDIENKTTEEAMEEDEESLGSDPFEGSLSDGETSDSGDGLYVSEDESSDSEEELHKDDPGTSHPLEVRPFPLLSLASSPKESPAVTSEAPLEDISSDGKVVAINEESATESKAVSDAHCGSQAHSHEGTEGANHQTTLREVDEKGDDDEEPPVPSKNDDGQDDLTLPFGSGVEDKGGKGISTMHDGDRDRDLEMDGKVVDERASKTRAHGETVVFRSKTFRTRVPN